MELYLVQHGEAEPESVNPARPLTGRGRLEVRRVARAAARLGLGIQQIRHSGKRRAEETAAILGEALGPLEGVVAVSGLNPNDDVRPVAEDLARESRSLMLVGHLPFIARLAGLLVAGDPDRPVVRFRYAAVVCLGLEEGRWLVNWVLTPEIAEATAPG
ncbi:MAG: phosphohistidine phosphatase SixA [Candidatus Rokubacteria bacterium]|nr:phosphohistidine phosphatase SixA [Candidatus Rokubacteria bacterium]